MPDGWIHQSLDLICFGEIYWSTHGYKDSPSKTIPGKSHRQLRHNEWKEWRIIGGKFGWLNSQNNIRNVMDFLTELIESRNLGRYPKTAPNKEQLASIGHELLDYMWDEMDITSRYFLSCVLKKIILMTTDDSFLIPKEIQDGADYTRLTTEVKKHSLSKIKKRLSSNIVSEIDRLSGIYDGTILDTEYERFVSQKSLNQIMDEIAERAKDISSESYRVINEIIANLKPFWTEINAEEQELICRYLYIFDSFGSSPILSAPAANSFLFLSEAYTLLKGSVQGYGWITSYFGAKSRELENSGLFPELSSELTKLISKMESETGLTK